MSNRDPYSDPRTRCSFDQWLSNKSRSPTQHSAVFSKDLAQMLTEGFFLYRLFVFVQKDPPLSSVKAAAATLREFRDGAGAFLEARLGSRS
jgi:hypothetical protein